MSKRNSECPPSATLLIGNDRGIIPIIGIAIFLGLIVVVLIAVVAGLDKMYQEQTGSSMFAKDAKIHELRKELELKKDQMRGYFSGEQSEDKNPDKNTAEQATHTTPQTADERMADVEQRLNSLHK